MSTLIGNPTPPHDEKDSTPEEVYLEFAREIGSCHDFTVHYRRETVTRTRTATPSTRTSRAR